MTTRIKSAFSILLLSSAIFIASTTTASAWFFDPFENMVDSTLQTMETLILGLSDDIGEMADRIGDMADKIGVMADRIVHTEQMMADIASQGVTCK